jgi:hypothetical protein
MLNLPTQKNLPFHALPLYHDAAYMLKILRCATIHAYKYAIYRNHKGRDAEFRVSER